MPETRGDYHAVIITAPRQDQADPRRWHYTTHPTRTAPHAAVWLAHRLDKAPSPFRPFNPLHLDRITAVAQTTAYCVERALDMARRSRPSANPVPTAAARSASKAETADRRPYAALHPAAAGPAPRPRLRISPRSNASQLPVHAALF